MHSSSLIKTRREAAKSHLLFRYPHLHDDIDRILSHKQIQCLGANLLYPIRQNNTTRFLIDETEYSILSDFSLVDLWHSSRRPKIWITHDIDYLKGFLRPLAKALRLLKCNDQNAVHFIRKATSNFSKNGHWADNVSEISLKLNQIGVKSIFFFLDQARVYRNDLPANSLSDFLARGFEYYSLDSQYVKQLILQISNSTFSSVGIHCALHTSQSRTTIASEIGQFRKIGISPKYSRFHYLRFNKWQSSVDLADNNIALDFSFGARPPIISNVLKTSQRFLLPTPNHSLSRTASISTIAMDSAIYTKNAKDNYQLIIDIVKQTKGEYSIILHNNLFLEHKEAWSDLQWFIHRCYLENILLC